MVNIYVLCIHIPYIWKKLLVREQIQLLHIQFYSCTTEKKNMLLLYHIQTKDYKIGICCFSVKHSALRRKSKDWLARESG
jgi:hypothetical protein